MLYGDHIVSSSINRASDIKIEQRVGQLFKNIYSVVKDALSHVTGSIFQCMQVSWKVLE